MNDSAAGLAARLRRSLSIDLRSLALFRAGLGILILADLVLRARDLDAFMTDAGVLPLRHWASLVHPLQVSLHAASGAWWWQVFLWIAAAVAAVALIVGYRTRLASIVSFVLLASLLNRNPLILQGGDVLLVVLAFWAMLLPLGAVVSFDAALQPERARSPNTPRFDDDRPPLYFSVATIGAIVQVLCLYVFTALLKTGAAWRVSFDAAYNALSLQHFATPIGIWMRQHVPLLKIATVYVLLVEILAPVLALLPLRANRDARWFEIWRWPGSRLVAVALLASLHVAFGLMLAIGLFPLIDLVSLTLLLPSALWVWIATRRRDTRLEAITIWYDRDCGFCLKMCLLLREFLLPPAVRIRPAQSNDEIGEILERENSWVVTDADGAVYLHWDAMRFLWTRRWPFKPIGWLMSLPPLMWLGHRLYRRIAENRQAMGVFTARWLPYRPLRIRPTLLGQGLAAACLYLVLAYNVTGLPSLREHRPVHVSDTARLLRLDQHWDMFAPYPLTVSIYPLVPGVLRSGEEIDLYELTSSLPDWTAPESFVSLYDGYRWRKYMGRVRAHRDNDVRRAFGSYLCRTWNHDDRPRSEQLATLEVWFVTRATAAPGEPVDENRHRVWRHWCFSEFASPT